MPSRYVELPLTALHESPHNPRRHFDEAKLQQLADNIAQVGVMQPLIVRPDPVKAGVTQTYEIAAGHRRYRAATNAKVAVLPCLVRDMSDQQFMEFLNIENLQREDVHPLDEAQGYEALMAAPYQLKVDALAAKVGKSVKYVYDRIKLLALGKPARERLWRGEIDAGHAILLARLTPAEQAAVMGTPAKDYADGGLFRFEQRLYDDEETGDPDSAHGRPIKVRSVREVEDWIKRHVRFNVKQADAFLFPDTVKQVANATQTKRTIVEITHEYLANEAVRQADDAKVYGEKSWKRADGQEGSKPCDRAVLGVIASGPGQGQAFAVCVNKDRCLVHWGAKIRARKQREKDREQGKTPGKARTVDTAERARQREAAERARDEAARAQWDLAKPAICAAVANRVNAMPVTATGELLRLLLERLPQHARKRAAQYLPCGTKSDQLLRFLAFVELYLQIDNSYWAVLDFPKQAARLKVDVKAILRELAPKTPVQTSAQNQTVPLKKISRTKAA
jgi:ParB/RepB/Spo0J family partition protein